MTRFQFGENWTNFIGILTPERIEEAEKSLRILLAKDSLAELSFLDVGSGSGLFSLAASNLGAQVTSFDFDADSVRATQALRNAGRYPNWHVYQGSILDIDFVTSLGHFDIVYAWGVLHHTGEMWNALENAVSLVKPDGTLAISLYRRTPMCRFWKIEKRLYSGVPRPVQAVMRAAYKSAYIAGLVATGRNPIAYVSSYAKNRGMDWTTNVHDWLGGYPYESTIPSEVSLHLAALGLNIVRVSERPRGLGLLGTGCDEFVAARS
jgi:2-polyprenyl-3-methyl-5-hydroxy-6-metoxy-1,4-benzoquinol methylase